MSISTFRYINEKFIVTVNPVQFEFCLRNIYLPMQPFMQDATDVPKGATLSS